MNISRIKKIIKRSVFLFAAILIVISTVFVVMFPNTSSLIFCLVINKLPDKSHIVRIRSDLEGQSSFVNIVSEHEKKAILQFKQNNQSFLVKKYIHKTYTSMFDMPAFHDYWEVWVRTDVVNEKPLTSYLVRLGLIKDTNAKSFFSNQCDSNMCKSFMLFVVDTYNKMYDLEIFNPIRLNITEMDETSTVSRNRISLDEWNVISNNMHKKEVGKSYSSINN